MRSVKIYILYLLNSYVRACVDCDLDILSGSTFRTASSTTVLLRFLPGRLRHLTRLTLLTSFFACSRFFREFRAASSIRFSYSEQTVLSLPSTHIKQLASYPLPENLLPEDMEDHLQRTNTQLFFGGQVTPSHWKYCIPLCCHRDFKSVVNASATTKLLLEISRSIARMDSVSGRDVTLAPATLNGKKNNTGPKFEVLSAVSVFARITSTWP